MALKVSKTDREHRLYDWREHVACEVTIQTPRVGRALSAGVVPCPFRVRGGHSVVEMGVFVCSPGMPGRGRSSGGRRVESTITAQVMKGR